MKLSRCARKLELLISSLLIACLATGIQASSIYYFDKFGHCQLGKYIFVNEEAFVIRAHGSGEPYQALVCDFQFQSHEHNELCLEFDKFNVSVCGVNLYVYTHWIGKNYLRKYDCMSKPKTICSAGKYLTIRFQKERIDLNSYDFQLLVYPKSLQNESSPTIHYRQEDLNDKSHNGSVYYRLGGLQENDESPEALTQVFIISTAVGSVLLLIVIILLIILLFMCCKNRSREKRKYHIEKDRGASSIEVEPLHGKRARQVDL